MSERRQIVVMAVVLTILLVSAAVLVKRHGIAPPCRDAAEHLACPS